MHRGADKGFGEDIPTCIDVAVRVGDHVPWFKGSGVWGRFDYDHVHRFAGVESSAADIDIGIWLVILLIGSEGRLAEGFGLLD